MADESRVAEAMFVDKGRNIFRHGEIIVARVMW